MVEGEDELIVRLLLPYGPFPPQQLVDLIGRPALQTVGDGVERLGSTIRIDGFQDRVDMVGHEGVVIQPVALAVEVQERADHELRDLGLREVNDRRALQHERDEVRAAGFLPVRVKWGNAATTTSVPAWPHLLVASRLR